MPARERPASAGLDIDNIRYEIKKIYDTEKTNKV